MKNMATMITLVLALALFGCSPARDETSNDPNFIITQAVQTVNAQLTQDAVHAIETQLALPSAGVVVASATLPAPQAATQTPLPSLTPIPVLAPSDTPVPSPTVPAPTPTKDKNDIRVSLGDPDFSDHFEADRVGNNWSLFTNKNVAFELLNQQVKMTAFNATGFYGFTVSWPEVYNGYIEMQATTGPECSGRDRYGLIFRTDDATTGYFVGFSCEGSYSIWIWDGATTDRILNWTQDSHILAGPNKTNRLGIKMQNEELTVYANGIKLKSVSSTIFTGGRYGMMIGSQNTPNFSVVVDWIEFWRFDP